MSSAHPPLLAVEEALAQLLGGVTPLEAEQVQLLEARGRVLAADVTARLTQPPFHASAMDGYAVRAADAAAVPQSLRVIGESGAGHGFAGTVGEGQAVRIFTGAPLPAGADAVVIQEDAARDGASVIIRQAPSVGENVRPAGNDFSAGEVVLPKGRLITSRDLMLAASSGHATLPAARRPIVALLATGDELVPPGATPKADQIVSSIPHGLAAVIATAGGAPRILGIASDTLASLDDHIAAASDADVLVTIGGASVGDHDLVQKALAARGLSLAFWRIAMRPGKPLMYGRLDRQRVLGLPGNPVSAMLCAQVFLLPLLRALQGAPPVRPPQQAVLAEPVAANGPRKHYMRARIVEAGQPPKVAPLSSQDSSLVTILARSDCLIVVPPSAPAMPAGSRVEMLPLEG